MRGRSCIAAFFALGPGLALAQAPAPSQTLDRVLAGWERACADIRQLDLTFTRTDINSLFKTERHYEGRAFFRDRLLGYLDLTAVDPAKGTKTFADRLVFTDDETIWYHPNVREVYVWSLGKQERARLRAGPPAPADFLRINFAQVLAMTEGSPAYFPFFLRAGELRERFKVTLERETATSYHVRLEPIRDLERDYCKLVVISLSKRTSLPEAAVVVLHSGKERQDYRFTSVRPNVPIAAETFQLRPEAGWKVVRIPRLDNGSPKE